MAIETWLPALLGYLVPAGLFLPAWGGMKPQRARWRRWGIPQWASLSIWGAEVTPEPEWSRGKRSEEYSEEDSEIWAARRIEPACCC
ncbi:MAG TPA: hypothetical protein ENI37_04445 [Chloroflexi bacterium]|nr:hypothetical protein [Chloroflexota bacterium]